MRSPVGQVFIIALKRVFSKSGQRLLLAELGVALYCRKRLFSMMNNLPTVFDVVTGKSNKDKDTKEKIATNNNSIGKAKVAGKVSWSVTGRGRHMVCNSTQFSDQYEFGYGTVRYEYEYEFGWMSLSTHVSGSETTPHSQ